MSKHQHTPASAAVGIEHAIRMLEGRWKLVILFHLFGGRKLRFSDLDRAIPAISQKMLSQQLRHLERDGIVARIVHPQVPPKVEYHLTKWGQSLCPALDELLTWAERQPSSPSGSQSVKATRPPRGQPSSTWNLESTQRPLHGLLHFNGRQIDPVGPCLSLDGLDHVLG